MSTVRIIRGANFSGRSAMLADALLAGRVAGPVAYIGTSAASSLSGLTTTVEAECALNLGWSGRVLPGRLDAYFDGRGSQLLSSLSGGEQVLLALSGLVRTGLGAAGLDTALEQLDGDWREWAFSYLASLEAPDVLVIDNRLRGGWQGELDNCQARVPTSWKLPPSPRLPCSSRVVPADIGLHGMSFCYGKSAPVFEDISLALQSGSIYHLAGANGAGKTTLLRILCGVLRPSRGGLTVNGAEYRPDREGNRLIALSMQNPDQQWTEVTVGGDLRRRLAQSRTTTEPEEVETRWRAIFADPELFESHVLDIPRAMRRRLSWIWPLSGVHPWAVFDEPTLGQDDEAVAWFRAAVGDLTGRGRGVILVSHDERLLEALPCQRLQIHDSKRITVG
jgi:energy-coupling factor transporter ATP-binding protein EcfA2